MRLEMKHWGRFKNCKTLDRLKVENVRIINI